MQEKFREEMDKFQESPPCNDPGQGQVGGREVVGEIRGSSGREVVGEIRGSSGREGVGEIRGSRGREGVRQHIKLSMGKHTGMPLIKLILQLFKHLMVEILLGHKLGLM